MTQYEPRVSCINIKKISKIKNISQFGLEQNVRERERREIKKASFFGDFTGFYRSELNRPRVKAALRDKSYAWIPKSQDFVKVTDSGFHENREKAVSREITLFEVGFFSNSV